MDGKLTGRLSPRQILTGRLSVMPRSEPPALIAKAINRNAIYNAADDNADGFFAVTVDVPAEPMAPRAFDLTGGYVASGIWTPGGDTVNYSDSYAVEAGGAYIVSLGDTIGSRFRAMFSEEDIAADPTVKVTGKQIVNTTNPLPYACLLYKPAEGGFITITKDNAGTAGLKTYVFCLADLIRGNE